MFQLTPIFQFVVRMRQRCGATCTSGSASCPEDLPYTVACSHTGAAMTLGNTILTRLRLIDVHLKYVCTDHWVIHY